MQRLSRRHAVLALLLVASIGVFAYVLKGGQAPPRQTSGEGQNRSAQAKSAPQQKLTPAAPPDVDFRRYASLASTDIFSPQRSAPAAAPPQRTRPILPVPPLGDSQRTSSPPPRPGPNLDGWTYVGYVDLDGEQLGVIQNDSTMSCEFLAVGDTFMGAEVTSVDRDAMHLRSGGATQTLSRPRDFSLRPLERPAGATQPPQPRPGPG
ncbi:MAG: hypothetical protein ACE149_03220 [Armatimonadota bacterium]